MSKPTERTPDLSKASPSPTQLPDEHKTSRELVTPESEAIDDILEDFQMWAENRYSDLLMAKQGIKFAEAKAALTRILVEARIDENRTALTEQYMPDCVHRDRNMVIDAEYFRDRIATLTSELGGEAGASSRQDKRSPDSEAQEGKHST